MPKDAQPCRILEWDTRFWGFRVASVVGDCLSPELAAQIDAWCCQQAIRCLYFLARPDDFVTTVAAEDGGYHLVDIRMSFLYRDSVSQPSISLHQPNDIVVRVSKPGDMDILRQIARTSYYDTRFFYDRNFPRESCRALYETWIERSCDGFADVVLVADLGGGPLGYISCHQDDAPGQGRIGLVGVSERARGQGIGERLVLGSLEWFRCRDVPDVAVVTQGRNLAAQRLYQRCAFQVSRAQLWYHKWYHPSR
jgi:dTDP-4-amino-4,6-dideoxy-D-galactose acyltransferase